MRFYPVWIERASLLARSDLVGPGPPVIWCACAGNAMLPAACGCPHTTPCRRKVSAGQELGVRRSSASSSFSAGGVDIGGGGWADEDVGGADDLISAGSESNPVREEYPEQGVGAARRGWCAMCWHHMWDDVRVEG